MSDEVWQFFLFGAAGVAAVLLWLFAIYLPRRRPRKARLTTCRVW